MVNKHKVWWLWRLIIMIVSGHDDDIHYGWLTDGYDMLVDKHDSWWADFRKQPRCLQHHLTQFVMYNSHGVWWGSRGLIHWHNSKTFCKLGHPSPKASKGRAWHGTATPHVTGQAAGPARSGAVPKKSPSPKGPIRMDVHCMGNQNLNLGVQAAMSKVDFWSKYFFLIMNEL